MKWPNCGILRRSETYYDIEFESYLNISIFKAIKISLQIHFNTLRINEISLIESLLKTPFRENQVTKGFVHASNFCIK